MIKHKFYSIETITNTSVGSGDVSFGIVDNLIQKDPVTFLPVFNSSSVKGSLRERMENAKFSDDSKKPELIKLIFGEGNDNPGHVIFYDARLLTLPLRSSKKVYYNCTSPLTIKDYLEALETFCGNTQISDLKNFVNNLNFDGKDFIVFNGDKDLEIEDYEKPKVKEIDSNNKKLIEEYLGVKAEDLAIFNDDVFKEICENSLPVIARNKISESGTSENLFYEEVLPRRSKLWFMLGFEDELKGIPVETWEKYLKEFEEKLTDDLVQFGANYSIGYGFTEIRHVFDCSLSVNKEATNEPEKD